MNNRVMIIAGEASGDLHGGNLVRAMQAARPELSYTGMGGKELIAAGVNVLFDAKRIAVVGIAEVFTHLPDILAARKILRTALKEERPALLIIIDFPDFNLMLARSAKKLGIPVFYYITPQVWAWRSGRVKTIRERVDKIGVILPFEQDFFRSHGLTAEYVGHPLLDTVKSITGRDEFCKNHTIDTENLCIGLLPGSRRKEIATLLPILLQTAQRLQKQNCQKKQMVFLLPLASTVSETDIRENGLAEYGQGLDVRLIKENRYDMMAACDAAVVVSGTVTLELALLDTPMIVIYKLSRWTYRIAQLLVNSDLKHFSLVNLIGGKEIVPELIQEEVCPERIEEELMAILFDSQRRKEMLQGLELVRDRMGQSGASEKAAELALSLIS
ncbi:lipid-A-disaccharide synthase [Desulfocapsa sulfexigens DSM 10523]|uniref:Lipid-A-disaccharide synthase n=1 Tax=Desulfocapsa sulfexigens (strain DSM 10523 / SB164P1) TaxID=1167006 RepID=M1PJN1_DESSD|nr:lipid-A-disaccharide synthase [Desulfocapsa sulfexigens]AGF79765.1 lipid-A-disaccharide synthase [Desulfocapsa sulfexigens DSM 10523]